MYVLYHRFMYADVDECSDGIHDCMQNCNNTLGSYICTCDSGFIIDADGRTCDGKHKWSSILWLLLKPYVWDVISCPCMQTSMNVAMELKAVSKCATTPRDPITASATMGMN